MPFEISDENNVRFRFPASIAPRQLHVGGRPNARFVRGYGSDDWFTVLDGVREAEPFELSGVLQTDRDEEAIQTLLDQLEVAVAAAARFYEVDENGNDVAYVELRGGLPVTVTPDGVDGTHLTVTVRLLPAVDDWTEA